MKASDKKASSIQVQAQSVTPRTELLKRSKELRVDTPIEHNRLLHRKRRDPIEMLEATNEDRLPQLIPLRHSRMLADRLTAAWSKRLP